MTSGRAADGGSTAPPAAGPGVLVTGASRGIGKAIAERFGRQGARVGVHYHRQREAAEAVAASLPGGPHPLVQADLADPAAVERMAAEAESALGGVDVLVNNAGIYEPHTLIEVDFGAWREAWERTLATNLLGPAHLCFHLGRRMVARGGGKIVNVSSRGAFRGEPEAPAYGASKAGLNALSQSLARLLAPHGVMVYAVAPGWVDTDMAAPYLEEGAGEVVGQIPLGRVASADEVARAVVFLAGEGTDSMTGCVLDVNGASYLR